MGKIAQPNTPYCGGFTQGAISAGGQIFTTQNPPISYTLSGKTATISDATGVIGEADLTGKLIESSRAKANPGVEYCGVPYAELKIGNTTFGTENPPISYALKTKALRVNGQLLNLSKEIQSWTTQQQSAGIRVDWGSLGVDVIAGTTWIVSGDKGWTMRYHYFVGSTIYAAWAWVVGNGPQNPALNSVSNICALPSFPSTPGPYFGAYSDESLVFSVSSFTPGNVFLCNGIFNPNYGNPVTIAINGVPQFTLGSRNVLYTKSPEFLLWPISGVRTRTVTSNTGATSSRTTANSPVVSLLPGGCLLNITYTDGTTQSFTYTECPTVEPIQCAEVSDSNGVMGESCPFNGEATAVCYDYDITEVTYSCEGNCPSAEFECRCEASNTLMCYGWDPNNPDVFKPLFVTSITSEPET